MSWKTVVISKRSKLDFKMNYMVVRNDESTIKVYLDEINILIIENTAVSLTAALLNELNKHKIKVIFCDEKRNPSTELLSYYGCHDNVLKIRNQINWSDYSKQLVWTDIVREKIKNQSLLLKRYNIESHVKLQEFIDELEFNDSSNREGHAAKIYFSSIFGKDFTRTSECYVNSGLNYGYAIILSAINREISASGYLNQLGIFHDNQFNNFNFGCDLIEPIRPIIDFNAMDYCCDRFDHDEKMKLVSILKDSVFINGSNQTLLNAIGIYVRSVFDAIINEDTNLIRYIDYEKYLREKNEL